MGQHVHIYFAWRRVPICDRDQGTHPFGLYVAWTLVPVELFSVSLWNTTDSFHAIKVCVRYRFGTVRSSPFFFTLLCIHPMHYLLNSTLFVWWKILMTTKKLPLSVTKRILENLKSRFYASMNASSLYLQTQKLRTGTVSRFYARESSILRR